MTSKSLRSDFDATLVDGFKVESTIQSLTFRLERLERGFGQLTQSVTKLTTTMNQLAETNGHWTNLKDHHNDEETRTRETVTKVDASGTKRA